jgi:hypothetical protein
MQRNQQTANRVPAVATQRIPEGPWTPISQPSLMNLADEALKWTGELEKHLDTIQITLFGPMPMAGLTAQESSIEEKLAALSSRLASLCGFTATLIRRLTSEPTIF